MYKHNGLTPETNELLMSSPLNGWHQGLRSGAFLCVLDVRDCCFIIKFTNLILNLRYPLVELTRITSI